MAGTLIRNLSQREKEGGEEKGGTAANNIECIERQRENTGKLWRQLALGL